jgi:hypothetical protein
MECITDINPSLRELFVSTVRIYSSERTDATLYHHTLKTSHQINPQPALANLYAFLLNISTINLTGHGSLILMLVFGPTGIRR